jgi:hypothetical protein
MSEKSIKKKEAIWSFVLGVAYVETWVWTADKQPVALLAKIWLGSASNSAASDKGHTGALCSKTSGPAPGAGSWGGGFYYGVGVRFLLFAAVGVLWSAER